MSFTDRFHEIAAEVRNWGRWGDDDRLGTLNLLTDQAVADAAATIRSGRRVPMAIDLSAGPTAPSRIRSASRRYGTDWSRSPPCANAAP